MNQGTRFGILLGSAVNCFSAFSVYAVNPASKEYVDAHVKQITTEISNLELQIASISPSGSSSYTVGQSALGGVIYFVYIDSAGDQHGLVAATADEPSNYIWGDSTTPGTPQYQCTNKDSGGYTDWILPNNAQLTALFNNRFAIAPDDTLGNGGLAFSFYWSSSSNDFYGPAYFNTKTGDFVISTSSTRALARCIRVF